MEPTKNSSDEPGKTTGGSTGTSGTTGTGSSGRAGGSSISSSTGSTGGGATGGSSGSGSSNIGGGSTGSSSIGGGSSSTGSGSTGQTGSAPQRAREQNTGGGGQSTFDQTKQTVTDAYGKTTEVLSNTYGQAMDYGRENPGKLTLIAFGAGIAIGLLLSGTGGRSRTNRIAEPVVNALSQVALEFFR
jgi:ElaB/YqjD/DUF883 family membrane-anchored ribosome-binding protein